MSNGAMITEIQSILQGSIPVPQEVTNRLILSAQVELYNNIQGLRDSYQALENRIKAVEDYEEKCAIQREADQKLDDEKDSKTVTWPYIRDLFAQPIVMIIVATIISVGIARLFP